MGEPSISALAAAYQRAIDRTEMKNEELKKELKQERARIKRLMATIDQKQEVITRLTRRTYSYKEQESA